MNFDRHNYVVHIKTEVMMLVAGGLPNFKLYIDEMHSKLEE